VLFYGHVLELHHLLQCISPGLVEHIPGPEALRRELDRLAPELLLGGVEVALSRPGSPAVVRIAAVVTRL
jgi:hypothetical protein